MRYVFLKDCEFSDSEGKESPYVAKPGFEMLVGRGGAMAYDPKNKGSQRVIRLNEVKVRELEGLLAGGIIRPNRNEVLKLMASAFPWHVRGSVVVGWGILIALLLSVPLTVAKCWAFGLAVYGTFELVGYAAGLGSRHVGNRTSADLFKAGREFARAAWAKFSSRYR